MLINPHKYGGGPVGIEFNVTKMPRHRGSARETLLTDIKIPDQANVRFSTYHCLRYTQGAYLRLKSRCLAKTL